LVVLRGVRLSLFFCLLPNAWAQFVQQGGKLVGSGAVASQQGWSVAISADGNTAISGGFSDSGGNGAVWIFARANGAWVQQSPKLVTDAGSQLGSSVAISADGNTAIAGGMSDNNGIGAAWVFTRVNGAWSQQAKLAGGGAVGASGQQGTAVAISADGNTALIGGPGDNNNAGALWVFTRTNGAWSQQGAKLIGSGAAGSTGAQLGTSVALSADGNTAAAGGIGDNEQSGAVWVYFRSGGVWTQQGVKLTGSGAVATAGTIVLQGTSVALSADGNTLIEGGIDDSNFVGAVWVFTRTNGAWAQQGGKLVPSDATISVGNSVSLSADGNTAVIGGPFAGNAAGGFWVYTRAGGAWAQRGIQQSGAGAAGAAQQGTSVAISADTSTVIAGGPADNAGLGAVWVFTEPAATQFTVSAPASATAGSPISFTVTTFSGYTGTVHFSSSDAAAVLPANTTLAGGTGAFSATLNTIGNQTIAATDSLVSSITGTSGAIAVGTGTSPVSVAPGSAGPASGSGSSQSFTFTFTDPRGYQDLNVVNVLFNNFLDGRNACYLAYARPLNVLYLVNDAGTALLPGLSNSQCSVAAGWSASGSGNTLTLTVNLTFTASFAGNKVTYLAARDLEGDNSGWQALGTWGIPGATTFPSANAVNPSRGSGSSQTFTFTFSDTKGAQDLGIVDILINNFLDGRQACYLAYSRPTNTLFLVDDSGATLLPGLSNSQCTASVTGSSTSGNTLTLSLNISFTAAFDGDRVIYLAARDATDANTSGWQSLGSWTVQ